MVSKDAYDAAKSMAGMLGTLVKVTIQEVDKEKTLELLGKVGESLGAVYADLFKEPDLNKVATKIEEMNASSGFSSKVEVKANKIFNNVYRCPVYDGILGVGFDHEAIKAICQSLVKGENTGLRRVNPKATTTLRKFRKSADDFCQEVFEIKK